MFSGSHFANYKCMSVFAVRLGTITGIMIVEDVWYFGREVGLSA